MPYLQILTFLLFVLGVVELMTEYFSEKHGFKDYSLGHILIGCGLLMLLVMGLMI